MIRLRRKSAERFAHGLVRGSQDVNGINRRSILNGYRPADMGRAGDSLEERRPVFVRQFLGIIETVESPELEENNGGGDDRASERSATGLIDAGDENDALLLESAFVPK